MKDTVHPRACGERDPLLLRARGRTGSSPRLRGTRARRPRHLHRQRFIPAPAGNARTQDRASRLAPVHPRACGERAPPEVAEIWYLGSSPRLRGTPRTQDGDGCYRRFIPAPAGNARPPPGSSRLQSVHPRACGERIAKEAADDAAFGSSPRLRGTRQARLEQRREFRFIPAPAGNARSGRWNRTATTVHPRACGERQDLVVAATTASGSSPRLRGTREMGFGRFRKRRFIPAPAGNAPAARRGSCLQAVHPRACGERAGRSFISTSDAGSSPRLRGTRS